MNPAFLLDEMLSPAIAEQLRQRGHDTYAITERADLVGLPDDQVLALGADEHRIVVTLNVADFASLHSSWQAQGRPHSGVIFVSTTTFPQNRGFIGALVSALHRAADSGELPDKDEASFLRR
jgi:predicted nuclease of predicted toxin-antitoxin system